MVSVVHQHESETTQTREVEALERTLEKLCAYLNDLIATTALGNGPTSREALLQREAFVERRNRALQALSEDRGEPLPLRIGNLAKLREALELSRAYFSQGAGSYETRA